MKNSLNKNLLLAVVIGMFAQNFCLADYSENTSKNFNIRATKESYIEFSDSIKINSNHSDDLDLKEIFNQDFNFKTNNFSTLDLITADRKKKIKTVQNKTEKTNFERKNKYFQEDVNNRIYDISLASGQISSSKINFAKPASIPSPSISDSNTKNLQLIEDAKQFINNKEYYEAENTIDEALKSENEWVLAECANLYENINKLEKASIAYEKAISLNPRMELVYSYALCLCKCNKPEKAKTALEKVIQINPQFMLAYFNLGILYYEKADYNNALALFIKSLKLNPLNTDSLYNTALSLEMLNHKQLAYKYYKKCLELNPNDTQAIKAAQRLNKINYL